MVDGSDNDDDGGGGICLALVLLLHIKDWSVRDWCVRYCPSGTTII